MPREHAGKTGRKPAEGRHHMAKQAHSHPVERDRPVDALLTPFRAFARLEASGGILLLICTAAALAWANSPWGQTYHDFWSLGVGLSFGKHVWKYALEHWVNDGLMTVFFFVVGLEIKRELLVGELASWRRAAVPILAAVGGMALPAAIYAALNFGRPTVSGWAVPAATDIAFALGVMTLLGKRVPIALKVFLTAVAIVDDLGAVLVIALFYTEELKLAALGIAGALVAVLALVNVLRFREPTVYGLLGVALWAAFHESGVHATMAGVLLAFAIPARYRIQGETFVTFGRRMLDEFRDAGGRENDLLTNPERQGIVRSLEIACENVETPAWRMEQRLHPWVTYFIMPVFALANAGVVFEGQRLIDAITSPVALGITLGLFVGKQLGVTLAVWLAVRSGIGELPAGTNWRQVHGAGVLAGIGFTMALFIANMAFVDETQREAAKIGILGGSALAGVIGLVLLRAASGGVWGEPRAS